jgi:GWxTD domain-containing protein
MRRSLAALTMTVLASPAIAQSTPRARAEAFVSSALASARAGDTSQALKLLDQAKDADDKYAKAFYYKGLFLARTTSMGLNPKDLWNRTSASRDLRHASDLAPDDPYPLLELGRLRLKMPFQRLAAEGLFQKALKIAERKGDPEAVAEVNFEIGEIYDRRYRSVANRHVITTPGVTILNPGEAQYSNRYVENFLSQSAVPVPQSGEADAARAEGYFRAALSANPGHEGSVAALCVILYDSKRYAEMVKIAHAASVANPSSPRTRLAEGLALLRMRQNAKANKVLEEGVSLLSEEDFKTIASIAPLMPPTDANRFETLGGAARSNFEKAWWDLSDPMFLTPVNEVKLTFLGRVAYADLYFSTPDLLVRGALTDRGKIILRYGEPPTIATFAPQVGMTDNGESLAMVTTLWWYPESEMRFVFVGPPAMNSARFAGDFNQYSEDLRMQNPASFAKLAGELTTDSVPVQMARFRGNQMLNTRVELYAAIPASKLAAGSGLVSSPVETAFMVTDGGRRRVVDQRDTMVVAGDTVKPPKVRAWGRQFRPGEYAYRIEALESQAMRGARATGAFSISSFPTGVFSASDILVGTNMPDPPAEPKYRDEINIDVSPDNSIPVGKTLALYWESYGAKPSADGTVRLKIDIRMNVLDLERAPVFHARLLGGIADKLGVSAKGDDAVLVSYNRTSPAPASSDDRLLHALNVQIDDAPAAEYLLEITMTDLESGQVTKISRKLRLRRAQ